MKQLCLLHVQVQRRASKAAQEQRKALMGSGDYMQRAQQLKTQQDLTNSAADTTASLQRTRQLMAEVTISAYSLSTLQISCPCWPPFLSPHLRASG